MAILMLCIILLSRAQQVEARKMKCILHKTHNITAKGLNLDKLKNTILLGINSLSGSVSVKKLYILLSLNSV